MGNDRRKIGVDDYMLASIMIYIDIIRIFMEILKYINAAQEKDKKKKWERYMIKFNIKSWNKSRL